MRSDRLFARVACAFVLAIVTGCGGSGSGATPPAAPAHGTTTQTVVVHFTLTVPAATANAKTRRPSYLPATAKSVAVAVNGGTPQTTALTSGSTQTIAVTAPLGTDAFDVTIIGTSGKPVSHAAASFTVQLNGANAFALTLLAVVAAATVDPATIDPPYGTALPNVTIGLTSATDADGNAIGPPFDPTTLAYADATSHLTPANGPAGNGAIAYDGLCMPPVAMTMSSLVGQVAAFTYGTSRIAANTTGQLMAAVTTANLNGGIIAVTATGGQTLNAHLLLQSPHPITLCGQGPATVTLSDTNGGDYSAVEASSHASVTISQLTLAQGGAASAALSALAFSGPLEVVDSVIRATYIGIVISNSFSGPTTIERSTFACPGRTGFYANAGSNITIDRTTIPGCTVGIASFQPTTVTKSTISGNTYSFEDSTNIALSGSIINSISRDPSSTISDGGYNDFVNPSEWIYKMTATSITSNPQLGALQNNGGPTQTLLPTAGSPVIGVIPSASCPTDHLDQRGYVLAAGSACSMGSVDPGAVAP